MTLANFKTYLKYDFKRTDKDTEITRAYNDMIMWIAAQMPHGAYKYQSYIYTVAGQEDYPIDPDGTQMHLIHPLRWIEGTDTNNTGYPMDKISKQQYDLLEPNPNRTSPSTSQPRRYCVFGGSILVNPIPDKSTYLIEKNWTKKPVDQSAESDVPLLGSEWNEIMKWGALERLYAGLGQLEDSVFFGSKYHAIVNGDDIPIGYAKKLFDNERDKECKLISHVKFNAL